MRPYLAHLGTHQDRWDVSRVSVGRPLWVGDFVLLISTLAGVFISTSNGNFLFLVCYALPEGGRERALGLLPLCTH